MSARTHLHDELRRCTQLAEAAEAEQRVDWHPAVRTHLRAQVRVTRQVRLAEVVLARR